MSRQNEKVDLENWNHPGQVKPEIHAAVRVLCLSTYAIKTLA